MRVTIQIERVIATAMIVKAVVQIALMTALLLRMKVYVHQVKAEIQYKVDM